MTIPEVVETLGEALAVGPGEHAERHERAAREQELHQDIGTGATGACNQLFHGSKDGAARFRLRFPGDATNYNRNGAGLVSAAWHESSAASAPRTFLPSR